MLATSARTEVLPFAYASCSPGTPGSCLLYNPSAGLFSLAYGSINDPADVDLVGYSSTDALAQWLSRVLAIRPSGCTDSRRLTPTWNRR